MKFSINVLIGIILSVLSGVFSIVFAYTVKMLVDIAVDEAYYSFEMAVIIIITLLTSMLIINYCRKVIIAKVLKEYSFDVKNKIFETFFLWNRKETDYLSVLNNDITTTEKEYIEVLFDLIMYIVMFLISTVFLFIYSSIHGLIILFLSIAAVISSYFTRNSMGMVRMTVSQKQEGYVSRVSDMFYGLLVVKHFLAMKYVNKEHIKVNQDLENSKYNYAILLSRMDIVSSVFRMTMFVTSYLLGGYYVQTGIYTLGMMISAVQLINNIVSPLEGMVSSLNRINGSRAIVKKINSLCMNKEYEFSSIDSIRCIEIKGLDFHYDNFFSLIKSMLLLRQEKNMR